MPPKENQETLFPDLEEVNLNTEFVQWDKEGAFVQGVFEGTEEIDGQYGVQNYWRIRDSRDTILLIPETVMLSRAKYRVKPGMEVAVMYTGTVESKRGNTVNQYQVFIKKQSQRANMSDKDIPF